MNELNKTNARRLPPAWVYELSARQHASRARLRSAPLCLLLALLMPACSGSSRATEKVEKKAVSVECAAYERELRGCLSAAGAPVTPADTFAAALAEKDEPARLQLEAECARNRVSLRASCK